MSVQKLFLCLVCLLSVVLPAASDAAAASPPNIVLILADDLGYGDLSCYGATQVATPAIDRLAQQGRRFTDAHSASSVCTPSRYALLTGEYPFRRGLWGPVMNPSPLVVDPSRATLASLLQKRGYATACFGKWHLGFGDRPRPDWNSDLSPGPLELGFDEFFGIPVVNSHPPFVWVENHRVLGLDSKDPLRYGGRPPTQLFPEKMLQPAISGGKAAHALYRDREVGSTLTEKSLAWLRAHHERPFFLYFATPHIHHPFTPAERFDGRSSIGPYGDFLLELDWMVGEILRTLDELRISDNTLVILTSDNGGMLNQGGQAAWQAGHRLNGSLLGFKFDAWEGGHRVPFIVRWPGRVEAGSVSSQLICHVDLLATLATVAGITLRDSDGPDSLDVSATWTGPTDRAVRSHVVLAPQKPTHLSFRDGHWMYIPARGGGGFQGRKPGEHLLGGPAALKFAGEQNSDIVDGRIRADAPVEQLYDLASDPAQSRNVVHDHPEIAARLRMQLAEIQRSPRSAQRSTVPGK